jgi:hypothetical protein
VLQKHHYAIAAVFFLIRGMKHQAKAALQMEEMLQIIICRLIGDDEWKELIPEPFYAHWWSERRKEAVGYMRTHLPECDLFSLRHFARKTETATPPQSHRYSLVYRQVDEWDVIMKHSTSAGTLVTEDFGSPFAHTAHDSTFERIEGRSLLGGIRWHEHPTAVHRWTSDR